PFQPAIRQSLAAALSEPTSADLDPVAGVERDRRLGVASRSQISVSRDVFLGRSRRALSQHLSRAGPRIRLRGGVGAARLGLPDLCRRDRRTGAGGGGACGREPVQRLPAPALRDADAARLYV